MIKKQIASILTLSFLLCLNTVNALEENDRLSDCLSTAGNTQSMRECIFEEVSVYDKKLNKYYKLILQEAKKENPEMANTFKQSQIAWLKFTEHNKNFYLSNSGTIYLVEADLNYLGYLQTRVKEFEAILNMYGIKVE